MTPTKKIMWRRPDGCVIVSVPQRAMLVQLQRGRPDYDPRADLEALRGGGLSEAEMASLLASPKIDLKREERKVRRNGRDPASIPAYLAFQKARNDGGKTFAEALQLIAAKDCWNATETKVCDPDEVPNDCNHPLRCFRGALDFDANGPKFIMEKCREIKRNELRSLRTPKLEALDIEYQRADERGDAIAKQEIAKRKQALRDVPADPRIDAALTPEELKAVLPECVR